LRGFLNLGKHDSLEARLEKIKAGDEEEREKFIKEYVPLVIKTIVKITNRYIEVENDDEFSIGIGALNEAIDRYSGDKGNFINYAALVIRSRIIDYERKIKKHSNVISINQMEDEDGSKLQLKTDGDDIAYSLEIREQIQKFKNRLSEFNISLEDLTRGNPKHKDTRLNAINIARDVLKHRRIMEAFYQKKTLPVSFVSRELCVSTKVLKRSKKYITATILALDSEFELIKDYIKGWEREVKSNE